MVQYIYIIKAVEEYLKCYDYPKAIALKNFNESDYAMEEWDDGVELKTVPSPIGKLQQLQEDLQDRVEYTDLEKESLHEYSTSSFIPIGLCLNGVGDWQEIADEDYYVHCIVTDDGKFYTGAFLRDENGEIIEDIELQKQIKAIGTAIEKSPSLQENTLLYRNGQLPLDIEVGDHGKFKSFLSTSYNDFIAFEDVPTGDWTQGSKDHRYNIRIFAPKGTKGIVLNRHNNCKNWQSELLLDKGQRYVVLAKNDDDMTADILLY